MKQVEASFPWGNVKITVPVPSCASCASACSMSIDENEVGCSKDDGVYSLTHYCKYWIFNTDIYFDKIFDKK